MRAFIRIQHSGDFYDQNCYSVYHGCSKLDIPIVRYKAIYSVTDNAPTDLVVGAFSDVKVALERLGVNLLPIDYPDELLPFTGRKIWKSTQFTITSHPDYWHVFVKPVEDVKRFRGTILDKSEDLIKLGGGLEDIEVWCSEKVNFLAEWRIWILDGKIIGINPYRGRWDLYPDPKVLQQAVNAYHSAPRAYALDFGITDKRETLLVEVSDAYALSSFGLDSVLYTKILMTRWQELTSTIKISVE